MTNSRPFLSCIHPLLCTEPLVSPRRTRRHRNFPLRVKVKKERRYKQGFPAAVSFPHPAITPRALPASRSGAVQATCILTASPRNRQRGMHSDTFGIFNFFPPFTNDHRRNALIVIFPTDNNESIIINCISIQSVIYANRYNRDAISAQSILLEGDARRFARFHPFSHPPPPRPSPPRAHLIIYRVTDHVPPQ